MQDIQYATLTKGPFDPQGGHNPQAKNHQFSSIFWVFWEEVQYRCPIKAKQVCPLSSYTHMFYRVLGIQDLDFMLTRQELTTEPFLQQPQIFPEKKKKKTKCLL